ncbi:acyl-CoA carboxylase subunit epsilon [Corynebacterium sp. H128]|uniref:acyl-CoA carboxylase subunit epsilon n=1 Tax=unclassified Corynebacterium TaxID=2624378 RepID=UPI0030B0BF73
MEDKKPFLTITKGNPDATQVAALTALFAGLSAAPAAEPTRDRNNWGCISERLQRPTTYNPNAFHNVSYF